MKVVVIGSGLAAVGSIRALVDRGIRPIVLDIGDTLPIAQKRIREQMASLEPQDWVREDLRRVLNNDGNRGRVVPKKLVLGSDYFYGNGATSHPPSDGFRPGIPPWSGARGGFSVGWGAAVLPPARSDLVGWPVTHDELLSAARAAVDGIPISEPVDELTRFFGRISDGTTPVVELTPGQEHLLQVLLNATQTRESHRTLVGQSRLLTDARIGSGSSCKKCGLCSSGCVYGSIYSAEHDIERWTREGKIDYRDRTEVFKIREKNNAVTVFFKSADDTQTIEADRVLLAAGAVSSARILVNSAPVKIDSLTLHRTGGFIQLFVGRRRFDLAWPQMNTQTSHLVELLRPEISPFWAHVQVGQPNELLLQRLGIYGRANQGFREKIGMGLASHIVTTILNVNSEHGPTYEMMFEQRQDEPAFVMTNQSWSDQARYKTRQFVNELTKFMHERRLLRVPFASQDSIAFTGYHFGSSFPMTRNPLSDTETDLEGRPFGWERVHVVDTSVLPAIPASGIGLIVMANSYRIASKVGRLGLASC